MSSSLVVAPKNIIRVGTGAPIPSNQGFKILSEMPTRTTHVRVAIIFGLIFATVLTLVFVPVMYRLLYRVSFRNY
ncbi:MAG: hypothetical protein O6848_06400 [Bacteroidetes bacterium]|nr:hypothetical protein [Bacteroidota bacterium]